MKTSKRIKMFEDLKPHIQELRNRLLVCLAALAVGFGVAFYFHSDLLTWLVEPLNSTLQKAKSLDANTTTFVKDGKITTKQVGGAFLVALKVSLMASFFVSVPVLLFQLYRFVAPGLYENEKKMLLPFVIGGSMMFFMGALFCYYMVMPFAFDFLITFGGENFTPYINIEDYVGFFSKIILGFAMAFELPIFTMLLAFMGLVNDGSLKQFFKYAVVIIFVVAAILTPPDPFTQTMMAAPLIFLYGVSIFIAKGINPEKP